MNELIRITENNGKQAVSARELYERLGYNLAAWSRWYKKNITGNQFAIEGQDYIGFNTMLNGNNVQDFALSLDFAKRLSMMARTEIGEQIRNYFIEVEKRATKPMSQAEMLLYQCQMMVEQEKKVQQLEAGQKQIEQKVAIIEAQAKTRPDYFTIVGYATLHRMQCGLKLASSLGRKASQLCKMRGIQTEEIPDPRFGTVKTYPSNVLEEVFEMAIN